MSYTNVDQVRHHLPSAGIVAELVSDQKFTLSGDGYLMFYGGAVDESSLLVKSVRNESLQRQTVMLAAEGKVLAAGPLVPGSVVVASDSSLGYIYVENSDYSVDYAVAGLSIKGDGELSVGQTVTVWMAVFMIYAVGVDYQVNFEKGEIRRLAGGGIASGETVYLDYRPVYRSFSDEILKNAVAEANGTVEREVDPEGQFGADLALVSAATSRALTIVCRVAAARELSVAPGSERKAQVWLQLAETYAAQSDKLLKSFRAPFIGPSAPVKS
ncbi:MAG: hypothetical protein JXA92_02475 [candidate division Zixibacteria bacterium]|nr:hypothetical protein [candidate division Zixibacteria bacterium]